MAAIVTSGSVFSEMMSDEHNKWCVSSLPHNHYFHSNDDHVMTSLFSLVQTASYSHGTAGSHDGTYVIWAEFSVHGQCLACATIISGRSLS